jgi:flagellar biosynthesis component FlhA
MNRNGQIAPAVMVVVKFGPALSVFASEDKPPGRELRLYTETALQGLLTDLGIPGTVRVAFAASDADPLQVTLSDSPIPYSADTARTVWEYVAPSAVGSIAAEFSLVDWSRQNLPAGSWPAESNKWRPATDFLSRLVVEIVKERPERLFRLEQVSAYLELARMSGAAHRRQEEDIPVNAAKLLEVIGGLLRLKVSVVDRDLVLRQTREGARVGLGSESIVEDLVSRLRSPNIRIDMHPAGIRRLFNLELNDRQSRSATAPEFKAFHEPFAMLCDGLFYELGIRIPPVEFRGNAALNESGFVVCLNHVPRAPRKGLAAGRMLVNETPERLALLRIAGLPARNPANGKLCAVIDQKDGEQAKELGITTWPPLDYLVLCLSAEIKRNSPEILDTEAVESELARLHEAFPALVLAAMDAVSPAMLTRILRGLLSEEISIRDLRTILSRVATYDYVVADTSTRIVFDDRLALDRRLATGSLAKPELYVEFVRQGMKNHIGHKYTNGTNNLPVLLMSPDLETIVLEDLAAQRGNAGAIRLREDQIEEIRQAVASEYHRFSSVVILTFSGIRGAVRRLIEDGLPQLAVLAYEELSFSLTIQPLARISVSGKAPPTSSTSDAKVG